MGPNSAKNLSVPPGVNTAMNLPGSSERFMNAWGVPAGTYAKSPSSQKVVSSPAWNLNLPFSMWKTSS